jgi:hypothetical protein
MKVEKPDPIEDFLKRIVRLGLPSENFQDWNRFYHFIALAHAHRRGWDWYDLREMLMRYGVGAVQAGMFSKVYWHCRCVLYNRDHFDQHMPQYANWVRKDGTLLT